MQLPCNFRTTQAGAVPARLFTSSSERQLVPIAAFYSQLRLKLMQ